MDGRFFSARQLASFKIRGLPGTERNIHNVAKREQWPARTVPGKGGRSGTLKEYQPPADVLRQINEVEAQRAQGKNATAGGVDSTGTAAGPGVADPRRAYKVTALGGDFIMVPRYDVHGSAGHGAVIHSEQIVDYLAFRADWVRNALHVAHKDLALISVKGDSMEPTLSDGDLILVDTGTDQVGDSGVYVLRKRDGLFVKRLQHKLDGTVVVMCDNARYDSETFGPEASPALTIVGRVVWAGRRL